MRKPDLVTGKETCPHCGHKLTQMQVWVMEPGRVPEGMQHVDTEFVSTVDGEWELDEWGNEVFLQLVVSPVKVKGEDNGKSHLAKSVRSAPTVG